MRGRSVLGLRQATRLYQCKRSQGCVMMSVSPRLQGSEALMPGIDDSVGHSR